MASRLILLLLVLAGFSLAVPRGGSSAVPHDTTGREADLNLLAHLIHADAAGEPYEGKVAIAAAVLNRVKDSRFPNTLESVLYQPGAFEAVHDGRLHRAPPGPEEFRAARDALNGWDPTHGAVFFWNPDRPVNEWLLSRPVVKRIGAYVFAR